MQIQSKAIVLHRTAYNDKYQIAHLYTEEYGRLGVLLPLGRSKRAQRDAIICSPLAEIEFVGELKQGKQLARLIELRLYRPNYAIQQTPIKCSQGIFISELLYRVLSQDIADYALYHFIAESLQVLHHIERGVANFYLCFTYRLLFYLAIEPTIDPASSSLYQWFDLGEAQFTNSPNLSSQMIPPHLCAGLCQFSRMTYANMHIFAYNREDRAVIIDYLLLYYRLHLPQFGTIKSLEVLRSSAKCSLPPKAQ